MASDSNTIKMAQGAPAPRPSRPSPGPVRAFPSNAIDPFYAGMSLAEWYAGQALPAGLITAHGYPVDAEIVAQGAWAISDAMMAQREIERTLPPPPDKTGDTPVVRVKPYYAAAIENAGDELAGVFHLAGGPVCVVRESFVVGGTREAAMEEAEAIAAALNAYSSDE